MVRAYLYSIQGINEIILIQMPLFRFDLHIGIRRLYVYGFTYYNLT